MTDGSLMKFESIAECSPLSILQNFWPEKGSILQYFRPALNDYWSWKPIFVFFLSGRTVLSVSSLAFAMIVSNRVCYNTCPFMDPALAWLWSFCIGTNTSPGCAILSSSSLYTEMKKEIHVIVMPLHIYPTPHQQHYGHMRTRPL